ncbi:MAG: DUF4153 domain-containing protein [candidate division Zixibacteria bacterium]|nr:DUF4153 domain-containing protein [candidate division Zixibacteria bacterium]
MGLLNKFPSFNFIYKNAAATFVRFPFTLLSAALGAVVGIMLIESDKQFQEYTLQKLWMIASLGLPLFTALVFYADKKLWDKTKSYGLQAVGTAFLVIYYFSWPENPESPEYHLQRFLLLAVSFHFLVAFIPFIGGNQIQGFWQYNKSLFLRFLTAALYSSVLYIGLTIALAAMDYLFGVDIDGNSYLKLWVVIVTVFQTWVFLAGVPADLNALNDPQEYPKGLKVLAQYILLPLVALYFLILISYEFKIIFEWNLPKGWVSQLVLWFSVVGILSLLLLHPLRERTESKWIKVFSKWFFRMLLPLLGMLFVAIWVRISDYGMTEYRYYVMAMAIGLSLVVFYFIFSKAKDIRIIPMVVFAIAILSAFGPWGAFAVSKASQLNRMEAIFVENEMLADGKVVPSETEISHEAKKDLSSITSYLIERHGLEVFEVWFDDSTLVSLDTFETNYQSRKLVKMMGFDFVSRYSGQTEKDYFELSTKDNMAYKLEGYDYLLNLNYGNFNFWEKRDFVTIDDYQVKLQVKKEIAVVQLISLNMRDSSEFVSEVKMNNSLAMLIEKYDEDDVEMADFTFDISTDIIEARLFLISVSGWKSDDSLTISSIKGNVLLRKK